MASGPSLDFLVKSEVIPGKALSWGSGDTVSDRMLWASGVSIYVEVLDKEQTCWLLLMMLPVS